MGLHYMDHVKEYSVVYIQSYQLVLIFISLEIYVYT